MSHQELLHPPGTRIVELDIEGMTCASCVNRVEKKLGKLDGVAATVNLPLESAYVTVPEGITDEQLTSTVEAAGYKARVRAPRGPVDDVGDLRQYASKQGPRREGSPDELASPGNGRGGTNEHAEHVSGIAAQLRPRLILAAALTIPVFLVSMVPAFQFPNWGWAAAVLALPVVTWAAWPFHRAAAINARHLASTMDTLVSLGVSAAYL